jgi:hypothetical protein
MVLAGLNASARGANTARRTSFPECQGACVVPSGVWKTGSPLFRVAAKAVSPPRPLFLIFAGMGALHSPVVVIQLPIVVIQSAIGVIQSAIGVIQSATGVIQSAIGVIQSATGVIQSATGVIQSAIGVIQSAIGVIQL